MALLSFAEASGFAFGVVVGLREILILQKAERLFQRVSREAVQCLDKIGIGLMGRRLAQGVILGFDVFEGRIGILKQAVDLQHALSDRLQRGMFGTQILEDLRFRVPHTAMRRVGTRPISFLDRLGMTDPQIAMMSDLGLHIGNWGHCDDHYP